MRTWAYLAVAAVVLCASACTSGGGASCSTASGTQLAATTWPEFRADAANSGRAAVDLNESSGVGTVRIRRPLQRARLSVYGRGAGGAMPNSSGPDLRPDRVRIGDSDHRTANPRSVPNNIYVASSDGNVYVVDTDRQAGGAHQPDPAAKRHHRLAAGRGRRHALRPRQRLLSQFFADGLPKNTASLGGLASASPNLWVASMGRSTARSLSAHNPAHSPPSARMVSTGSRSVFPQTQSTAALVPDPNTPTANRRTPIVVAGGLNGQVRAYTLKGRQYWSFFAASTIVAAVMIDPISSLFYVADSTGHVFAGTLLVNQPSGQLDPNFTFTTDAGITASPALSRDSATGSGRMYVADRGTTDRGGKLYALDRRKRGRAVDVSSRRSDQRLARGGHRRGQRRDRVRRRHSRRRQLGDGTGGNRRAGIRDSRRRRAGHPALDVRHRPGDRPLVAAIGADGTVYIGRQGTVARAASAVSRPRRPAASTRTVRWTRRARAVSWSTTAAPCTRSSRARSGAAAAREPQQIEHLVDARGRQDAGVENRLADRDVALSASLKIAAAAS